MLGSRNASLYDPVARLQQKLSEWTYDRPVLVTSLIHENNFVRSGAEGWTLSFYTDTQKTTPRRPPFDLNATDPSTLRSAADQTRIWENYERLVAWGRGTPHSRHVCRPRDVGRDRDQPQMDADSRR